MVNKVKKKKGFTLVELLAVIVILAIILVIAVPTITNTIKESKKGSLSSTAKLIANAAETKYLSNQALGKTEEITCESVAELTSEDYESCNITFNEKGEATVVVVGKGQFEGLSVCEATRDSAEVTEGVCPTTLASGDTFNHKLMQLADTTSAYNYNEFDNVQLLSNSTTSKNDVKMLQSIDMNYMQVIPIVGVPSNTTITSIEILGSGKLPAGYTKETLTALTSVDVSANEDNSIVAYYDNGKVYVYSEGKIVANPDASCMFRGFTNLTNLDVSTLDTSKVTHMWWMFYDCSSLTSLDLSNFDTSNVTDMSAMFHGCSSLASLDLSSFDTSNVTDMSAMFRYCSSLTTLDLSNFDTSDVTDMSAMFRYCSSLTTLDLSNFDTSNVTDMSNMFGMCSSLTTIDLSNFDTSNVTYMDGMFGMCSSLTTIDLSNFDTSKVTDMSYMFYDCYRITTIDFSNADFTNVTSYGSMLSSSSNLTKVYVKDEAAKTFIDGIKSGVAEIKTTA